MTIWSIDPEKASMIPVHRVAWRFGDACAPALPVARHVGRSNGGIFAPAPQEAQPR
jgi:hypothetical protein